MVEVAVVGAGAAGCFAAIRAAQLGARVLLLEATAQPLAKVRISGGGRCNVTHACFEPAEFATRYPRGDRELRAAFGRYQARDLVTWFNERGIVLKTEDDGRIFPATDDSATIAEALLQAADRAGVELRRRCSVRSLQREATGFRLTTDAAAIDSQRVLLATGGSRPGMALAASLGHRILEPVPALFTLRSREPLIDGLAGVSATVGVRLRAAGAEAWHAASGPLLITHWGLSGPALLKASSWAARDLANANWRGEAVIDWCPDLNEAAMRDELRGRRRDEAKRQLETHPRPGLPRRLWERLVARAGLSGSWAGQANERLEQLLRQLKACSITIEGKGPFSEEFVVCGGVDRSEIDWRRMESRLCPGLHLAGEIIDQDGLTGGFNLQAAWTTGWIAGSAMGEPV